VGCRCGMRHTGLRRRREQRIVCRSCGASLFVLPRDSYPAPKPRPVRKKKPRRAAKQRERTEVDPTMVVRRAAAGVAATAAQVGTGTAKLGAKVGAGAVGSAKAVRKFWTPLRLVAAGMMLVLAATLVWSFRTDNREQAIRDLKLAEEAAREALAEDDLESAHQNFSRAVAALDELERHDDPLAQEIRQLDRELTAIRDQAMASPLEIATEAERLADDSADDWESQFRSRHEGRWVVIDGPFRRVQVVGGEGRYEVDIPFRMSKSNHGVRITGTLPALDALSIDNEPQNVIVAAQLSRCDYSGANRAWEIELKPETAFLWSSVDNYTRLGFTLEDQETEQRVRRTLERQSRANRGGAIVAKFKSKRHGNSP